MKLKIGIKIIALVSASIGLQTANAGSLASGVQMISSDLSITKANSLWKGDSNVYTFADAQATALPAGGTATANTTYYNVGVQYTRGLANASQLEFRVDYATSGMENGNHGATESGDKVSQLAGVELKYTKDFSKILSGYVGIKHPTNSDPDEKTFIAVNDYSTHYFLGLKGSMDISQNWYQYWDIKYISRSRQSDIVVQELPADQGEIKLDFLYTAGEKLSLGAGLLGHHTFHGLDIGRGDWGTAVGEAGHPPFYAVRDSFAAHTFYVNYYYSKNAWYGLSHFEKFYGRNTDISRTITFFAGKTF